MKNDDIVITSAFKTAIGKIHRVIAIVHIQHQSLNSIKTPLNYLKELD